MNPISKRLLNQQLACPQFSKPEEVVEYMGATQAQDYRMMRWAVAMRTHKPSLKAFAEAYNSGRIIRLHLMRGTWQLVSPAHYWMLQLLCAPKAIAVTKGWMNSSKVFISDDEMMRVREVFADTASAKGSATKNDFVEALADKGITLDDHHMSFHLRMAEFENVLCSGDLQPMNATYSLVEDRLPRRTDIDRDETLAEITRIYFRSRQPATLEDFVWWSGLNISDCRRGIEMLGNTIHMEKCSGREFYLTDDCRTRGFRKGSYILLPSYDEYLISYKSRDLVLNPDFSHKAHNNSGIFQPIVLKDGEVCGNWSPFKKECNASFFLGEHNTDLQDEWEVYQKYLAK